MNKLFTFLGKPRTIDHQIANRKVSWLGWSSWQWSCWLPVLIFYGVHINKVVAL